MSKVLKFGGSSLADAEHFLQVKSIVQADPERTYVVPSAPGRRFSGDDKVTDLLYACYETERRGEDLDPVFARVIERYSRTVKPMYLQFIEPSKRYADIIFPEGGRNLVAIDVITAMVEKSLREKQQ